MKFVVKYLCDVRGLKCEYFYMIFKLYELHALHGENFVAETRCPIDMLIMQNEPNLCSFSAEKDDFEEKRTQNEPKRTQFQSCFLRL